jgi:hypothetical protein
MPGTDTIVSAAIHSLLRELTGSNFLHHEKDFAGSDFLSPPAKRMRI